MHAKDSRLPAECLRVKEYSSEEVWNGNDFSGRAGHERIDGELWWKETVAGQSSDGSARVGREQTLDHVVVGTCQPDLNAAPATSSFLSSSILPPKHLFFAVVFLARSRRHSVLLVVLVLPQHLPPDLPYLGRTPLRTQPRAPPDALHPP